MILTRAALRSPTRVRFSFLQQNTPVVRAGDGVVTGPSAMPRIRAGAAVAPSIAPAARLFVMIGLCLVPRERAASAAATDDELRIHGVFDSALPGTERKNSLRLIFHPHFGDLTQRDHLRVPFGLRYGLTEALEVTAEAEGFLSHGFGDVAAFRHVGLSALHFGTKYRLGKFWLTDWDTAVGLDYTQPVGTPPTEITDGLKHIAPYVSFSRRLERAPDWRVFWSLGLDEVRLTRLPMSLRKNELGADAGTISGGFLRERGAMTYTLEAAWTSSRISGRFDHDVFTLRPGLVWVVPPRFTWGDSGRWLVGAGLRLSDGPDGFDVGVNAKLRVNFDFRRFWRKIVPREP